MSVEAELLDLFECKEKARDQNFKKQISDFEQFRDRLNQSGYTIEKKKFSIALMERMNTSFLKP